MSKRRLKPKSRELMREIADIVKNSETDEAALEFLKDTLEDDFPHLDLGSMDLHEAIAELGGSEEPKRKKESGLMGDLNDALGNFIDRQEEAHRRRKRRRRK